MSVSLYSGEPLPLTATSTAYALRHVGLRLTQADIAGAHGRILRVIQGGRTFELDTTSGEFIVRAVLPDSTPRILVRGLRVLGNIHDIEPARAKPRSHVGIVLAQEHLRKLQRYATRRGVRPSTAAADLLEAALSTLEDA